MKRQKRSAGLIKTAIRTGQSGSIVVEAAIVVPLLLFLLFAFSVVLSLSSAQMALHSAASQAVRQVAAHIYPIDLAREKLDGGSPAGEAESGGADAVAIHVRDADDMQETDEPSMAAGNGGLRGELSGWQEIAAEAAEWLPQPAGELVSAALQGDWRPLQNMAATELGKGVIEPFVRQYANPALLEPERVTLAYLTLPDLKDKTEPYVAISLEYEYPIRIPIVGKSIVLREQAYERVWVSDALAARYGADDGIGEIVPLQVVAIEPNPLRPGQKATAIVLTRPGEVVSLGVMYKSGASKAKYLGEATADDNGYVRWTWHVSGNTTPGIWYLTASAASGEASVSKDFAVEKKDKSS